MRRFSHLAFLFLLLTGSGVLARANGPEVQATSNSGTLTGTVTDPTGAIVPGATIRVRNFVSGYDRSVTSDAEGNYQVPNLPYNNYHVVVSANGFNPQEGDVIIHSPVAINQPWKLPIANVAQTVNVQADAGDLLENDSTFHTDIDRKLMDKIPLESSSSSVSSLVTLASPGISADSNGLFHGLGDHAENSFSVDGQPITDQQSKVFSNQIPMDSIQSIQVISGAPPAEYGDKTSVVIDVTTRSGLGTTTPTGSVTASYGSFGSSNLGVNLAYGTAKWGNFISANGLDSGRFLDPPEFAVMHDNGNEENVFDRVDYQLNSKDALHTNLGFTRSWFQTPNSYDNLNYDNLNNAEQSYVGPTDQRAQIRTFNIAPTWTHIVSDASVLNTGVFVRRDYFQYFPSDNPYADLGPPNLQRETIAQQRSLTNAGFHSDFTYSHGINNVKVGVNYGQTFLNEDFQLSIVDPTLNPPTSPTYNPLLGCYDLTHPQPADCAGTYPYFIFHGHTDVKQLAMYVQDAISKGNWNFNVGIRGDLYNGLSVARQAEPRVGLSYNIKRTNTVLRASYANTMETPFNENLILSATGCNYPVIAALVQCVSAPFNPGFRNEFHAGFQQAFGRYVVASGEYINKYTHNAYDFSVLGNTPITFPIEWHNSKIPGYAGRINVPDFHGFSLLTVMSSVAARFFTPQIGGLGTTVGQVPGPFRIDHDEKFNQTTHLQYQPRANGPWMGFNWRYDSGQVAGAVPCYGVLPGNNCPDSTMLNGQPAINLSSFTADQEFEAGFICNGQRAAPYAPLPTTCLASQFSSTLVKIPAPNTENDDKNPPRVDPRSLFDLALGDDTILPKLFRFPNEKDHISGNITVVNLANKYALYNFLSTFSGTHYVTPRAITATVAFNF